VISGVADVAFQRARDAFAENFEHHPELGASFCVVLDGRTVVDVWGGHADAARTRAWEQNTLVNVFSAAKGIVSAVVHRLTARGALDIDSRVSVDWPEFGAAGKGDVPVRWLLDHSAGLAALRDSQPTGTLYDWDAMVAALAAETPWWQPGTAHGYHAVTFGFLVGEVARRATGNSIRELVAVELANALDVDLYIGVPVNEYPRVAEIPPTIVPESAADNPVAKAVTDPTSLTALAFANPADLMEPGVANTARWRAAEIPASNAHANARALARLYGALAREDREDMWREHRRGIDQVLGVETAFSAGFMLPSELRPFGRGVRCFGHPGAGGSLGFADPDIGLGFGYTPNQTIASMAGGDPRWTPLIDAVYECVS